MLGALVVGAVALLPACTLLAQSDSSQRVASPRAGPPVQGAEPDLALLERFDRNADGRLDRAERDAARAWLRDNPAERPAIRGRQLPATGQPGARIAPADVPPVPASVGLYDSSVVRTIFIELEGDDWERELADFWHTDVEVPATVVVDGVLYRDVGVGFRGNNSFHMVPDGLKRSASLSFDAWSDTASLLGHNALNLLNSNQDPTFLRSVLFLDIARRFIPAPRANFVRVVINGESWGLFVNQQTFGKALLREQLGTGAGTRWKSPNNSPGGGFGFLGDSVAPYRRWYEQKGKDDPAAWAALVEVARILATTPPERLETALAERMDVDEVLRFLALDIALVNGDGYWNDGSDFNVLLGADGRFRALPHDVNEAFRGRGDASAPDPLVALADTNKALRHRLLAVPALRMRYLRYVGEIAETWLDWARLGPLVDHYVTLVEAEVARDTRKLSPTDAFRAAIFGAADAPPDARTLKGFAALRRAVILAHPAVREALGR
jgi:CotH kinase protein